MSTFAWIVVGGIAMSSLALVGSVTVMLPERTLQRIVMPLVALAAGSLLGGAVFHMLPSTVQNLGNDPGIWAWLAAGFVGFFFLEQFLHWHHCHRTVSQHGPLGYLILLADGTHNFIGGLAVAGAFIVDIRLGIVTWLVAAAHEVPQELGDFGILVHSGWSPRKALAYNFASAITFLIGGLIAFWASGAINVAFLVPFAAGNFIYIAAADLLPQITSTVGCDCPETRESYVTKDKIEQSIAFIVGLVLLYVSALFG